MNPHKYKHTCVSAPIHMYTCTYMNTWERGTPNTLSQVRMHVHTHTHIPTEVEKDIDRQTDTHRETERTAKKLHSDCLWGVQAFLLHLHWCGLLWHDFKDHDKIKHCGSCSNSVHREGDTIIPTKTWSKGATSFVLELKSFLKKGLPIASFCRKPLEEQDYVHGLWPQFFVLQ